MVKIKLPPFKISKLYKCEFQINKRIWLKYMNIFGVG